MFEITKKLRNNQTENSTNYFLFGIDDEGSTVKKSIFF